MINRRALSFAALRVWCALCLFLGIGLLNPNAAYAHHFRSGSLSWHPGKNPGEVDFHVINTFIRDDSADNPLGKPSYPGTAPDGLCQVGDIFTETVGRTTFSFGDGQRTPTLTYIVTGYSVTDNFIIGEALNPGTTVPDITHTYTGNGPFTNVGIAACCRLSTLNNRGDNSYNLRTTVMPNAGNQSPVTTLVPVVVIPPSATASFTVPAYDPDGDGIRFRLATNAEAAGGSGTPDNGVPGLSIDPISGVATVDATNLLQTSFYTDQFVIEDLDASGNVKTQTPVDFLLQIRPIVGNPPSLTLSNPGPISVAPGSAVNFKITGTDPDAGDQVTLNTTGLPAGATVTPALPVTGASGINSNFSWTPTAAQVGTYLIAFSATDSNGQQALKTISINVGATFTLTLDKATYSVGESAGTLTANVLLSPAAPTPILVTVKTTNGTALAGSDYNSLNQTLILSAGQTSKLFTMTIRNDAVTEPTEAFTISLSGATVTATLGTPSTATVTILDDDVALPKPGPLTGSIAFSSARDGNNEIYIMNADGTSPVRLTNNPATDDQPNLSRDGKRIVFSSLRDRQREIYVMNSNGSNLTRLTNNLYSDYQPHFSVDGTKVVFVSTRNGNPEIYVMTADGTGQTRLTNNAGADDHPCFNNDGTQIVFHSRRLANDEIYRMNSDGSGVKRLTAQSGVDTNPNYSNDGTRIVFQSNRIGGQNEIFWMNADGSSTHRVSFASVSDTLPCFSPDGTRIAFTSTRGGGDNEIILSTLAGEQIGGSRRLTVNFNDDNGPSWGPVVSTGGLTAPVEAIAREAKSVQALKAGGSSEGGALSAEESNSSLTVRVAGAPAEAAAYSVTVNGSLVAVVSATVQEDGSVVLALPEGALSPGADVSVSWHGQQPVATKVP